MCVASSLLFVKSSPTNRLYDAGTVRWTVSKSALHPRIIRANLAAAQKRAFHPFFLPTGVEIQDMKKVWHGLQFNPAAPVHVPFNEEFFRPATRSVQILRQLAQKGQSYLDSAAPRQRGRDKFVLGLPNDAREVASLLVQAHAEPRSWPFPTRNVAEGASRLVDTTTTTSCLPAEPLREPDTPLVVAAATYQDQELARRGVVPQIMAQQTASPSSLSVEVGEQSSQTTEQADQSFLAFTPSDTNTAGSHDCVSESTVAHLEEMLSEDQRRIMGDQEDQVPIDQLSIDSTRNLAES